MASNIGRKDLGIRNPFKRIGYALIFMSLAALIVGALLALQGMESLQEKNQPTAITRVLAAAAFIVFGLKLLVSGLLRTFKFYTGHTIPASLAEECDEMDGTPKKGGGYPVFYNLETLEDTMDGKEIHYELPRSLVDRCLYALFPRLLLTPPPLRRFAENSFAPFFYTLWILLLFGAVYLLHVLSLHEFRSAAVFQWLAALYGALIFYHWTGAFDQKRMLAKGKRDFNISSWLVALSLLAPVALELYDRHSPGGLPMISANLYLALGAALLGSLFLFAVSSLLLVKRLPKENPDYEVSDERENREEDTHPSDLFRIFNQIMLEVRNLNIPNRCYYNRISISSGIGHNQTAEKGEFSGKTIHETQPLAQDSSPAIPDIRNSFAITFAILMGALLFVAGLATAYLQFSTFVIDPEAPMLESFYTRCMLLLIAVFFLNYGLKLVLGVAQFFASEIPFLSTLILFRSKGSFRATRLTTGASFKDSQKSESELINSSFSNRLLASQVHSSVFAYPGAAEPFKCPRYLIALDRADLLSKSILLSLREFLHNRQKMSTFTSDKDAQTVQSFNLLNTYDEETAAKFLQPTREDGADQASDPKLLDRRESDAVTEEFDGDIEDPKDGTARQEDRT